MYSPGLLPVAGTDDLTLNVRQFRAIWLETLRIVDGMRGGPLDLPAPLKVSLDSLREHVSIVLASIDAFLRNGGTVNDDAFEVANIDSSLYLYLQELLRVKANWNAWIDGETASFSGVTLDVTSEQQVIDSTEPRTNVESLIFLAGGALVIGALLLMRK